ncbi:MAG TPA: phospholipase D-like domain-containing protein [Myxococcales bacterium]|nr:phospholipase D-like domain-containing protein [Myxococcales bacterium]
MRKSTSAALAAALTLGCFGVGRKPIGEVRLPADAPDSGAAFSNALYQTVGVRLVPGNEVVWVNNGKVFAAAVAEIRKAKKSIHIVSFLWSDSDTSRRLSAAIAERARKGVACRIIVDAIGSLSFGEREIAPLADAGCSVQKFRPVPGQDDLARNHRKIIVVDGRVGITGGFGIDDKWRGRGKSEDHWRDSNVLVRGPAVATMQQAFAENWQETASELLPADAFPKLEKMGPTPAAFVASTESGVVTKIDRLTQLFIAAAHKRVWIANAYFVPSEPILELLERKAREGVDVRILAAGEKTDAHMYLGPQRERMDRLIAAGARGFEYQPSMMHSKTILVDDSLVQVGSSNLDALSLNKMDEGAVVADDMRLAKELEQQWVDDLLQSAERVKMDDPRRTAKRPP